MKTLKSFSLKLFAILMLFALIACSGDDDSVPQPSPADNKIITELKKYKWTYNGYDPKYEQRMIYTLYFINDNMGVGKFYDKSPSMGTNEESITFTYRVDKNNIFIKYGEGGSTFDYLWIGDGTFIDPDYNEVYKRSEYTSEDYKYVKDYDPVEIQKKKEKREVIKKNFSVKVTKKTIKPIELDDWHLWREHNRYTFTFESTLEQIYPTSKIDYYICFVGDCDSDESKWYYYSTTENKHIISNFVFIHFGSGCGYGDWLDYAECRTEYDFFFVSFEYLHEKLLAGEKLTENETQFYKELDNILSEFYCYEFNELYPCITIDGEPYEFEELRLDLP